MIEIRALFEEGKVKNAKFLVYGCPGEISTTDPFIDFAKGKTIEQALKISKEEIPGLLWELPLSHMPCSKILIKAFKKAVEDYRKI